MLWSCQNLMMWSNLAISIVVSKLSKLLMISEIQKGKRTI
ncbi:hypothetical protein M6B38_388655 [Iris pallida]|uniref:Uncharacterized protein n=1 Tax=Iris pallida TaxID=29817 RepID=A0AAX6G191_IRIPA|nr:hypothetical protein M6B38_388655 [Iris pallida]